MSGKKTKRAIARFLVTITFFALLSACGGGGGSSGPPPLSVNISPSAPQALDASQTLSIMATVANDSSGEGVSWSLTGAGSLSGQTATSVTYNAPGTDLSSSQNATVTATSMMDSTKTASLKITANPLPTITTVSLPNGTKGSSYSQVLTESGGTPPFTWSILAGAVPNGLNFNAGAASINGTPSGGGTWYFEPQLTDATGFSIEGVSVNGIGGYPLSITVQATIPSGNSVPFISQPLLPDAIAPGGAGFSLTVNGAGFVSGAAVNFDGMALATHFVSSTQLTANVPASSIASAATASITVVNPAPGGGVSNVAYLPIAAPEATVTFSNVSGSPMQTDPSSAFPVSVVVADFNGDGKPDLAVTNQNPATITIFLGTGQVDGTFTEASGSPMTFQTVPFSVGLPQNPGGTLVGDFDNSGKPGLAVLQPTADNVAIFVGNGDGMFMQSTATAYTQGCPSGLAAADFIGNGNLDLVLTNSCGAALAFLLGYGDGAFTYQPGSSPALSGGCSIVGDFNGDGKLDLACALYDQNSGDTLVYVLLGNGDGTFAQAPGGPITIDGVIGAGMAVSDFNGDGKLDLAVATGPYLNENSTPGSVYFFLGNGDGTFNPASGSPLTVGMQPGPIAVADFNGDGKVDVAIGNVMGNNVTLLMGNGDGTFTEATGSPFTVGRGPGSIAVADFNESGRLGLAVVNYYDRTISILVQQP